MKNIDQDILDYFDKLVAFSPDTATDAERKALLNEGVKLIEAKTDTTPKSMEEIVDRLKMGVNTDAIVVPEYLRSDIDLTREEVGKLDQARKVTKEAYRQTAKTVFTTLIRIATLF